MSRLNDLNLAQNNIEIIQEHAFNDLRNLVNLNLDGNQIRSLAHNPFKNLAHLEVLQLNSSNFVCNCMLEWITIWLNKVPFEDFNGKCSYPPKLQGKSIYELLPNEMSCDSLLPHPIIIRSPANQIVLLKNDVTLACVAEASSLGEEPIFKWRKNNRVMEPYLIKTHINVIGGDGDGGAIYNVTSFVTLKNVTHEDSGDYQCEVRNKYGVSYSERARINVYIYPYFTKKPMDVEAKVGGTVEMECAALGFPPPNITWHKVGSEDFPAARERRFHVYTSDTSFFIKPIEAWDDGRYVCRATNEAGVANSFVTISVKQTPMFSKPLQDKEYRVGDTSVLECQVNIFSACF